MEVNKVAVLGAGTMGMGIAWAVAGAGKKVVLYDIKKEIVDKTIERIGKHLQGLKTLLPVTFPELLLYKILLMLTSLLRP